MRPTRRLAREGKRATEGLDPIDQTTDASATSRVGSSHAVVVHADDDRASSAATVTVTSEASAYFATFVSASAQRK